MVGIEYMVDTVEMVFNPPCLCLPPCSTVWHCAHALVNIFLPASADILVYSLYSATVELLVRVFCDVD